MRKLIDRALERYLPSGKGVSGTLHEAMRYSVLSGGKRVRPMIVLGACRACGGGIKDAMPAACAIEFVHTYSLIHDDLPAMDDDDTRRGKPASHKVFGEAAAILAGDALLTLAFNIIAGHEDPRIAAKAVVELSEAVGAEGMVLGQALDVGSAGKRHRGAKEICRVNELKTARLFKASARLGAIAAGAGTKEAAAMGRYGAYFGRAFQIADDIADGGDYVKVFGIAKARADLKDIIDKAEGSLKIFGRKADILRDITHGAVDR